MQVYPDSNPGSIKDFSIKRVACGKWAKENQN